MVALIPTGPSASELARHFVRELPADEVYQRRLDVELGYIDRIEGAARWLREIALICRAIGDVPHTVRGSAGSSLVTWLLGISSIDPVRWAISPERFLNPLRDDLPDVDLDFPYHRREEVYRIIEKMYPGRVARISTHVRYRDRSALREALRRAGYRRRIPRHFDLSSLAPGDEEAVLEMAAELKGTVRTVAKHVGGVVIFDGKVPPEFSIEGEEARVRLDKHEVKENRFFKLDVLSSRALAQLCEVSDRAIEDYPEDHAGAAAIFETASTLGITQCESPAFRKLCRAIRPRQLTDVIMCFALIRPAAAWVSHRAMFHEEWRRTRTGGRHLIYEDDATAAVAALAQISLPEADRVRRWFARRDLDRMRSFAGSVADRPGAGRVLEDLSCYNGFSFCKSHAVSYGRLAWALAQLKHERPMDFWRATLDHAMSTYRTWVHVQEAKRAGWEILEGRRPWRSDGSTLYNDGACRPLVPDEPAAELRRCGFWTTPGFFPDCGETWRGDSVTFAGLVATSRIYKHPRSERAMTFVTVGTGDGRYRDVVLEGAVETDDFHLVVGRGVRETQFGSTTIRASRHRLVAV